MTGSICAARIKVAIDTAFFAEFNSAAMAASSLVGSPHPSPSNSSMLHTSSPPPKKRGKKRKFEESAHLNWEPVNKCYSHQLVMIGNKPHIRYRCTLCFIDNLEHFCKSEGDMRRHFEYLAHSPVKSICCRNSGCSSTFTQKDALKRHKNTCKYRLYP